MSDPLPARDRESNTASRSRLTRQDMEAILDVTRHLAAPFELSALLAEVTSAARRVLRSERASVWLHDAATNELVLEVASDIRHVRIPIDRGLVGAAAQSGKLVNTPDCYADPRFDRSVDVQSGFHTRCSLALPLIDHQGGMVGAMQVLNKRGGVFDAADEALAEALAAQCAMALQRARMTAALIEGEKLRQELELASVVQHSTLPHHLPQVPGYDMHGTFMPAAQTGGDTYDLALLPQGLLVVLGDATGHGIAPALSVLQMHAMLRMAMRLGATLEAAFTQVNDQLSEVLPDSHFVTAFVGLLEVHGHRLRFLSGGQGPILHFKAAEGRCTTYRATSFPMGAMPIVRLRPAVEVTLAPGDWLAVLSDGVYEYEDPDGQALGAAAVEELLASAHADTAAGMSARVLSRLQAFARGAPQEDDITMVLLKRLDGVTVL
jgi:phosphoserine phosphatase RsbU/P